MLPKYFDNVINFLSRFTKLHVDREGASYSVSVAILVPIIVSFVSMAIEVILLFLSQQALNTGTETALHTTQAWLGHRQMLAAEGRTLESQVRDTVARAMVPFASAKAADSFSGNPEFPHVLRDLGIGRTGSIRLSQKFNAINEALRVKITPQKRATSGWRIQVEYDSPLWIPGVARYFETGRNVRNQPIRTLTSEVWLSLPETDLNRSSIGIPYSPRRATVWPR